MMNSNFLLFLMSRERWSGMKCGGQKGVLERKEPFEIRELVNVDVVDLSVKVIHGVFVPCVLNRSNKGGAGWKMTLCP